MGCQTKENCWLNELFVNRYRVVQLSGFQNFRFQISTTKYQTVYAIEIWNLTSEIFFRRKVLHLI